MSNSKRGNIKGILPLIFGLSLILIGLSVYLYPKIANLLYENKVTDEKEQFLSEHFLPSESASEMEADTTQPTQDPKLEELYEYLKKENEELYRNHQNKLTDPFAYQQTAVDLSDYGLKDNIIGYVTIDKMKIVLPILLGASVENMRTGAVHLTETSYPIGGNNSNCVLAAHRGAAAHEMFRNIEVLETGDKIIIENFREKLIYRVSEITVIGPSDVGSLLIQEGRDLITLITCHPLGRSDYRYVVFCERVNESAC